MPNGAHRWLELGAKGANLLARFVFPETCAGCGAAGAWLCELCERDLLDISERPIVSGMRAVGIDETLARGAAAVQLRARFAFTGPARKAVHLLKYSGERARAEWFAEVMAPLIPADPGTEAVLVPVPLTARRERWRGFNQSAEVVLHLSRRTGIPVVTAVSRIRETRPQVELNDIERLHNVRGAFRAEGAVRGKRVILVDDVLTTGATMRECGRACYQAGAIDVQGIAATAGIDRH